MARSTKAPSALAKAMNGDKVTDRQAQSALSQALDRITSLTKRAQKSKEAMGETGAMVIHTAETQGSLFLSSMAEGYFGADKLKVGAVDVRAPVGLLAQAYGLYEAMSGSSGTGRHALALGNGVVGSWLASVAVNAGKTLADKGAPAPQLPELAPMTLTPTGVQGLLPPPTPVYDPMVQGHMREVLLTPQAADSGNTWDDELEGRGDWGPRDGAEERFPRRRRPGRRRRVRGARQRFLRARRQADAPDEDTSYPAFDDDTE